MSRYLTNIYLDQRENVERAAEISGMAVEFRDHPMPADVDDFDFFDPEEGFSSYNPDNFIGIYGSIYTNEPNRDHTPFWVAYDKIRGFE